MTCATTESPPEQVNHSNSEEMETPQQSAKNPAKDQSEYRSSDLNRDSLAYETDEKRVEDREEHTYSIDELDEFDKAVLNKTSGDTETQEEEKGHLRIDCQFQNVQTEVMIDTGAEINIMPRSIYEKLESPPPIQGTSTELRGVVEGTTTSIAGTISIKPQIADWDLPETEMRVPEKEINISIPILGPGYLKKAGLNLILVEEKLENSPRKEAIPMRISSSRTRTHLLRSAESKIIKPYTSIGVRARARKSKRHPMITPLINGSNYQPCPTTWTKNRT